MRKEVIQCVKVDDFDSLSMESAYLRDGDMFWDDNFHPCTYVPIPMSINKSTIKKVTLISSKGEDLISLRFQNGERLQIRKISEAETPDEAIAEALAELNYKKKDPQEWESWIPE